MKRYILTFLFFCSILFSFADNGVSITGVNGAPGEETLVTVSLANTDNIVAVQVEIPLDEELTYVDGSFELESGRLDGHTSKVSVVNNVLKVYIYSATLKSLPLSEGKFFSFKVKLGNEPGNYTLSPSVILSDENMKAVPVSVADGSLSILASKIELSRGTVNFGHVAIRSSYSEKVVVRNVGTTELVVNNISFTSTDFSTDLTSMSVGAGESREIEITYSPEVRGKVAESMSVSSNAVNAAISACLIADPYSVNELIVGSLTGESGTEVTVPVSMTNMENIVAVQCTFALPDGIEFVDKSFTLSDRAKNLSYTATSSGGLLKLYIYSTLNIPISGNDGEIASFRLLLNAKCGTYDITPTGVVLGNSSLENMVSKVVGGSVNVQSPIISCSTEFDMGSSACNRAASASYSIRNDGEIDLVVSDITFSSEDFYVSGTLPVVIAPDTSKDITVCRKSGEAGDYSAIMRVYSNDPESKMVEVNVGGSMFEPNYLTASNVLDNDGKGCTLTIGMNNYSEIVAAQMDIYGLEDLDASSSAVTLSGRCTGMSKVLSRNADGSYRVMLYSVKNEAISGNEGNLFKLAFTSDAVHQASDFNVIIRNIKLSNIKMENMSSETELQCETVSGLLPGDADSDGSVTVNDAIVTGEFILSGTSSCSDFSRLNADVNQDGVINIADLALIIQLLNGN